MRNHFSHVFCDVKMLADYVSIILVRTVGDFAKNRCFKNDKNLWRIDKIMCE